MQKWYKPIVKTYYVSDLVKEIKVRASSYYDPIDVPDPGQSSGGGGGGGGDYTGKGEEGGGWWCPIQECTKDLMCDRIWIA